MPRLKFEDSDEEWDFYMDAARGPQRSDSLSAEAPKNKSRGFPTPEPDLAGGAQTEGVADGQPAMPHDV